MTTKQISKKNPTKEVGFLMVYISIDIGNLMPLQQDLELVEHLLVFLVILLCMR
jgi:hypothetical protein